jgi:hypothetical protein
MDWFFSIATGGILTGSELQRGFGPKLLSTFLTESALCVPPGA